MSYSINETISDIPTLFVEVSKASNAFGTGLVIFVWAFIALTGYFAQGRRTGRGHMAMWMTIGGFFTTIVSFLLFLIAGIISLYVLSSVLVIFVICAAWFLFSEEQQ